MARIREVNTGREHQLRVVRAARRELNARPGGIILADGVGLGKTYEALATAATLLAQRQHGRTAKRRQPYRILILVPPGLVTKWATELEADGFLQYIQGWAKSPATRAVYRTLANEVVVLRRFSDLLNKRGNMRYGKEVLPPGCYVTNSNLLDRPERKATQLHNTAWDVVIIDEAHRIGGDLASLPPHTLLARSHMHAILLTATPFQLAPGELRCLLSDTFGGYGQPSLWRRAAADAKSLYADQDFHNYRRAIAQYFRSADADALAGTAKLTRTVSELLRHRMLRNPKRDKRQYHFVTSAGQARCIGPDIYRLGEADLHAALGDGELIELLDEDVQTYLAVRNHLAAASRSSTRPFVAGTLRQLLSTYQQFRKSRFGRDLAFRIPSHEHPKLGALKRLVRQIVSDQVKNSTEEDRKWLDKVLVFSTFVGADTEEGFVSGEDRHGTASTIKNVLEKCLRELIRRPTSKLSVRISTKLVAMLRETSHDLRDQEQDNLRRVLRRFAGSRLAGLLLANPRALAREAAHLKRHLLAVGARSSASDSEKRRRENDRRALRLAVIHDRYGTRDLVARYDGAVHQEDRDRHLRGFNSPFCPVVLVASSVGQEGIDLQRYCSHVIHYDLEWNPARLEQREGRVDRQGREAKGPVNVYFLLCRDTYDERVLHVMVNRMRWHQVLLPNRRKLASDPSTEAEPIMGARELAKVNLDLRPRA